MSDHGLVSTDCGVSLRFDSLRPEGDECSRQLKLQVQRRHGSRSLLRQERESIDKIQEARRQIEMERTLAQAQSSKLKASLQVLEEEFRAAEDGLALLAAAGATAKSMQGYEQSGGTRLAEELRRERMDLDRAWQDVDALRRKFASTCAAKLQMQADQHSLLENRVRAQKDCCQATMGLHSERGRLEAVMADRVKRMEERAALQGEMELLCIGDVSRRALTLLDPRHPFPLDEKDLLAWQVAQGLAPAATAARQPV
eukprot:TRINITY_DN100642_c0_g1_i1.p1 TRINITY_DN100642_c0_g1~~TRINITY_DN100642_c0_g1_i1.p1  ORF type:complete len:256 (+),score=58.42 TRINITY_DN100642_c0_g1_i1:112-879(+)